MAGYRPALIGIVILFSSTAAVAQSLWPLPNQLSVGIGLVGERHPNQSGATAMLSLASADSSTDFWPYRLGFVWVEAELGPRSDVGSCQTRDTGSTDSDCDDAALLTGLRFHFFHRKSERRVLPFINLLAGSYWKGSPEPDRDYASAHFALQAGGGVDVRRTGSAHGLRLAVDYRRVFAADAPRNQFRFVVAYTLGP
jgi:hypothetical protein